jgi:hypothetical protein
MMRIYFAILEYFSPQKLHKWPDEVHSFIGEPSFPSFEHYRSELDPPHEPFQE